MNELIALTELKRVFIGEIIKDEYRKSGLTINKLASILDCHRDTVINMFKSKSMDMDRLIVLSDLFNRNLLEVYWPRKSDGDIIDLETLKQIFIGKTVEEEFRKSGLTINKLANMLGCHQDTVTNMFKSKSMDVDRLIILSDLFNRNLLEVYWPRKSNEDIMPSDIEINSDNMYVTIKIGIKTLYKFMLANNINLIDETGKQSNQPPN